MQGTDSGRSPLSRAGGGALSASLEFLELGFFEGAESHLLVQPPPALRDHAWEANSGRGPLSGRAGGGALSASLHFLAGFLRSLEEARTEDFVRLGQSAAHGEGLEI